MEHIEDIQEKEGMEREFLSDMEKYVYLDRLTISYKGVFNYAELMVLIRDWCKKNGYYREISHNKMIVKPDGKEIGISMRLHKKISRMKDILKNIDGFDINMNEGEINIVFMGYLMTHLKGRWESRPKFAFVRRLIDKFVYKLERSEYPGTVVSDGKDLANNIRGLLYLYEHRLKKMPTEEEVKEKFRQLPENFEEMAKDVNIDEDRV